MHRVLAWFWFWFLMNSSSLAQTPITAELGQTVILPCKAPSNNKTIQGVQWNRLDQKEGYVLLYRDRLISEHQDESFTNRVDLQDKKMKDGDVSLSLKNVKENDTGTYECYVLQGQKEKGSIIYLEVLPPGNKAEITGVGGNNNGITGDQGNNNGITGVQGNNNGIVLGPVVGVLLPFVLVAGGFLMCRRKPKFYNKLKRISKRLMRQNSNSPPPTPVTPDDQAAEQLMNVFASPAVQN